MSEDVHGSLHPARPLLERWVVQKCEHATHVMVLDRMAHCGFEYRRRTHSSSYAFVEFRCSPSDSFLFRSIAEWPLTLDADSIKALECQIEVAVIDSLFCHFSPHSGCRVDLVDVRWDDVRSSDFAFYEATVGAMQQLLKEGEWRLIPVGRAPSRVTPRPE